MPKKKGEARLYGFLSLAKETYEGLEDLGLRLERTKHSLEEPACKEV